MTFEKAMKRLEEITQLIQKPDCSLDDALKLYQEGIELSSFCDSKLKDFTTRLTELNRKAEGNE